MRANFSLDQKIIGGGVRISARMKLAIFLAVLVIPREEKQVIN